MIDKRKNESLLYKDNPPMDFMSIGGCLCSIERYLYVRLFDTNNFLFINLHKQMAIITTQNTITASQTAMDCC